MSAGDITNGIARSLSASTETAGNADALSAIVKEILPANDGAAELVRELAELRAASQRQAEAMAENTDAVALNTSAQGARGESTLATAGKTAGGILSSGFGLSPLITGLFHLFGGGDGQQSVTLPEYTMPQPIRMESVYSETDGALAAAADARRQQAPAQITIQVQAMDSRSFLDHSDDIARAVRSAMLNSNSLNDVVNEL